MSKIHKPLAFMSIWDFLFTKEPIWMSRGIHIPFCICAAEEKRQQKKTCPGFGIRGFWQ